MKALIKWIYNKSFHRPQQPYRPHFDDESFFTALAASSCGRNTPRLQEALQLFHASNTQASHTCTAYHFRTRSTPRFFTDLETLRELAQSIATVRADWKARTLERAQADCQKGLPIYATQGPPLLHPPRFPWEALPPGPENDTLYPIRPQRFAFAPRIGLADLYGGSTAQPLSALLKGWIGFASSGRSRLPYLSNLVVIQRLIALSWTWAFLAARPASAVEDALELEFTLLKVLYADAQFLLSRLGNSYPNNHLLADHFAGWYIGLLFPEFISEPNWLPRQESLWLRELRRQIYDDGTGFEHSVHYHELACEMAAAYVLLSRRNGCHPPEWVCERLARMLRFQLDLGGPEGSPPAIGNATEDPFFPLATDQGWGTAALREIQRFLFSPELPAAPLTDPAVERAFWLLGGNVAPQTAERTPGNSLRAYPDGGFFIFYESDPATRLILRTGPAPGQPLVAGHMHADLLSVYLTLNGVPTLVEAGTYSYRSHAGSRPSDRPSWHAYLRGPESHNSLVISGEDPLGPLVGDFRPKEIPTRVMLTGQLSHTLVDWVEGTAKSTTPYEGYRRGVIHIHGQYWLVYDVLPPAIPAEHASVHLQLAPQARIAVVSKAVAKVSLQEQGLWISGSHGLVGPEVVYGRTDPPGGWVSNRYGELTPAPQIRFGMDGSVRLTAFLLQSASRYTLPCRVETRGHEQEGFAFRIGMADQVDYVLLRPLSAKGTVTAWDIQFDGTLLWLRLSGTRPLALRWLQGRAIAATALGIDIRMPEAAKALHIRSTSTGPHIEVEARSKDFLTLRWPADPVTSHQGLKP